MKNQNKLTTKSKSIYKTIFQDNEATNVEHLKKSTEIEPPLQKKFSIHYIQKNH